MLLQIRQRVDADATKHVVVDVEIAVPVHIARGAEQLQRRFDGAGEPEDEEDEGAEDDDAGEQEALGDEVDDEEEEEDGEAGGADLEDEEPGEGM